MRIVSFVICVLITIGLVFFLNIQLPVAGSKTPCLGSFLSPQQGFWQNAEPSDVDYNANLNFDNLKGNVNVYFDDRLVPHVYAEQENDAYFIQGYLHAKFRLWQMEFQTHIAAGRFSEIMGEQSGGTNFLRIDKFFRRLGMVYGAEQSLKKIEADSITKNETDAYTAGVNAYISSLKPNQIPFEYKLLNYKPELWTNLKTALFLKFMSYDLASAENDFEMTNAKHIFSAEDMQKLYPPVADSLDPIIPKGTVFSEAGLVIKMPANTDSFYNHTSNDSADIAFTIKPNQNNGSNNWAVAGSKTKSGAPILCNDPHLGLNLPSLWYEMQITTPAFSTYGVSFPGAPSIIIGFNDSCAWGVTNAGRDVKDYYEIQFRDSTMQEYMFNGAWTKAGVRNEVIKIKGKSSVTEKMAMTIFGPVMYDHYYTNKLKDGKYYALRWKAHDASNELLTFNRLDRAKNYTDYINAINTYQCPGQNFVFASKRGDIAIKQQGLFPAKWKGQGNFLMPGIDSSYMWQGFIPVNENPGIYNPERGFVSSANQRAVDTTYPYFIGGSFPVDRGLIINRMLSGMSSITIQDMQKMQTDNYNVFAEMARPILLNNIDVSRLATEQIAYINKLKTWNLRNDINEEGATIFKVFWDSLEVSVFEDEFAQTQLQLRWPDEATLVEGLIKDTAFKFVDDIRTSAVESLRDIVLVAFKKACQELKIAKDHHQLAWGKYKETGVSHLLKIPALSRLHLPIGGGEHIINATTSDHGPSWRMIVQLSNKIEAYGIYPGGQSGNPGSKYYDTFIDKWADGKYYPLLFLSEEEAKRNGQMKWTITFSKA